MKNLVIVESPAKAKTIEGYLGKDFTVKSSYGHIRDLPDKGLGVDLKNNFRPQYEISDDKKDTVKALQKLADESDTVWLATDDDREGEAISWHLKEALNLEDAKIRRIVFREITKKAILNAIESPRGIDLDLVNAQQARRILDRLVGYELSPVLWKKIKTGLSAGRVQSVAVRLIVDREREIEGHKSKYTFNIKAIFDLGGGKKLVAELPQKFDIEGDALDFLTKCIGASFSIKNLEKKLVNKYPAPPFTTSTLQQEASRKLYFSVSQTMLVAQKLYESGKITYMRTDSVNLSEDAIANAKQTISKEFGDKYANPRRFKTKSESAQEAHEAIRPTNFATMEIDGESNEKRLYDLIWKRAIASQMADAELERTTVQIAISTQPQVLTATGEVIKFDGFLKVYLESSDDEDDDQSSSALPPLNIGQMLNLAEMNATQRFSRPAPRYSEAALVKKLEEMGIGRPSTYAPTITTIIKRNYVVKENREGKERAYQLLSLKNNKITTQTKTEIYGADKSKLFPTDLAMVTNDFLTQHFDSVVDFSFTANVEKEFDHIAEGKMDWVNMLHGFYDKFHKTIETSETISRKEVSATRLLGEHPTTKEPLYVKLGKYGAYVQKGENEDVSGVKPVYANLKKGQLIESLSLEEALELFKLPRESGHYEDKPMKVAVGKFGPYIQHDGKFYSLAKTDDPLIVTEERCIAIIEDKRKTESERLIKEFNAEVKVLNGRYGPYIVVGKKNVKIPKDRKPEELTLDECLKLAETTPDTPAKKGRFFKKKA
ncbi:MAG: type I DNA topoisomerase [Bacteroidota bacterium]|nr:type I DNA topoisomerase [Bacteroidota bacterium]